MKTLSVLKNRRGVSAVISNLILIGAVIAVGFAFISWSQGQASNYNNQYSNAIKSDTDKLRERIAFEYIYYNNTEKTLKVFLMNSGTVGGLSITNVYVNNSFYGPPALSLLSATPTLVNSLNATQEGYFSITPSPKLAVGNNYPIMIITGRGSSFAATFAT